MTGGAWKNASFGSLSGNNSGNATTPLSASQQQQRAASSSSSLAAANKAKAGPKRIVPYVSQISTLESNWDPYLFAARSPQSLWKHGGNNDVTYLIVRANEGCCLNGGVESVLKWSKLRSGRASGAGGIGVEAELSGNFDSSLSFSESRDDNGPSGISYGSATHSGRPLGASRVPSSGGGGGGGGVGGSMRFLKSGLKKAQQSFERGVTTIAIKADGGKNPDQLCVSLHYSGGLHGHPVNANMHNALGAGSAQSDVGDVCLSRTEWVELPSNINLDSGDVEGLLFSIPLCIPDLSFLEAAAAAGSNGGVQLTIRLCIRSGAVILKAVANREYCIGESSVLYSNVMGLMQQPPPAHQPQRQSANNDGGLKCGTINVPFTTGMLAETSSFSNISFSSNSDTSSNGDAPAALHITAAPRVKFNRPCTYGWSLTDPVSTPPAGPNSWRKMFQLPLDQGYVFQMLHTHLHHHRLLNNNNNGNGQQQQQQRMAPSNSAVLLANERAVESCVTLPLATACSRLFATGAVRSQNLALNCAEKTRRRDTVHLPSSQEDDYRSKAIIEAALLEGCALVELGVVALVLLGEAPPIDTGLNVCGAFEGFETNVPSVKASVGYQPPHTIFEELLGRGSCPLLDETTGAGYVKNPYGAGSAGGPKEAITTRFCPRILTGSDDLLPGVAGTRADGRYVGSIRLEVLVDYANSVVDNISTGISGGTAVEGVIDLEQYLEMPQQHGGSKVPIMVPGIDANTGKRIGTFVLLLNVKCNGGSHINPTNPSASSDEVALPSSGGLVSMVGMDTLTESLGLAPYLDCDVPPQNSQSPPSHEAIRRRQIATMGSFASPRHLVHQANVVRKRDANVLSERYSKYHKSLMSGTSTAEGADDGMEDESDLPLYQRRTPRPFRPSNSRGDALLSGIGFNVHVQSLSLNVVQDGAPAMQAAVAQSVTHGAPADHAKGFGGEVMGDDGKMIVDASKDASAPRGGLRRLESKRAEFAKELDGCVMGLISAVGDHFKSRAQAASMRQQAGIKPSRHIPAGMPAIRHYRIKAMECIQKLHSLTWDIAVRRANCFSQALGIAVTSYLASLSDGGPAWRGYASIWARHGYLITFEGLLSAVGKELGMIEDASAAISMLRMVNVVLVPADSNLNASSNGNVPQHIPVPHSPYVRWVKLTTNGSHSKTQYQLEIALDPSYYQNRVPDPLKNGVGVRFFPILFQMGVDIRQWGVNAGRSVTGQIKQDKSKDAESAADVVDTQPIGSLIDDGDEDDEAGVADNEINLALNVEGYRKLNAYAHSTNPITAGVTAASAPGPVFDSLEQAQAHPLPLHPSLVLLSEAIKASAGKMEHSVLDRAATACQRFGGGSTVFCKSGKDRTAMQVTFKQAQFVQRFTDKKDSTTMLEDTKISYDSVFSKSTLMRKHGNRIPICEKNAGEPKFAFNPLQRKFMPEMLRPDASLCTWSKPET